MKLSLILSIAQISFQPAFESQPECSFFVSTKFTRDSELNKRYFHSDSSISF